MLSLVDAPRCPYCARVRIALAEKGLAYASVAIDLDDRPAWVRAKNPANRVPILETDGLILPESEPIVEYLDEVYPDPPLLPADAAERALARLSLRQFDHRLGNAYYACRRDEEGAQERLARKLDGLEEWLDGRAFLVGSSYSVADVGYVPWLLRARHYWDVDLSTRPALSAWVERLLERPAVAAEAAVVAGLSR